jgi:hypothetical protein
MTANLGNQEMKKRSANFHMSRSVIIGKLSHTVFQTKLGRYQSMMSCAVRPDRSNELIVHLCMYQPDIRDRYPNADEAYLAVDIFDHHSPELRQARMRKLLNAGLAEYWALDTIKQTLTAYRHLSGQIIAKEYEQRAKVPLDSFPDVVIDLHELFSQVGPQKYGRGMAKGTGLSELLLSERAKDSDQNQPMEQE